MRNQWYFLAWILLVCCACGFIPRVASKEIDEEISVNDQERQLASGSRCGCDSCTTEVLGSMAEGHTCGSRIDWLKQNAGYPESLSCRVVAEKEYPSICGACNPTKCTTDSKYQCGCSRCTDAVWNTNAGEYTWGERISWVEANSNLNKADACRQVSEEYPDTCTCNPDNCSGTANKGICGCEACNAQVLNSMASGHTCRDRIDWVVSAIGASQQEACKKVASEFPTVCGVCHTDSCGSFPQAAPTSAPRPSGGMVKAMSYNTQYNGYQDGRVPNFGAKMREVGADVIGVQECQDANALAAVSGYNVLRNTGSQNYIFYDSKRLRELDRGYMSIPRDDFAPRAITWGKFRVIEGDGSGSEFWFFNTHLPHQHNEAADKNTHARIGRSLLAKRNQLGASNTPTIVVGDMNPYVSVGAPEGSFESNIATGGLKRVYIATGSKGGLVGFDKIFASEQDLRPSNGADHGTGSSDHPAITVDLYFQ
mmetsp:Transcript_10491/g.22092  ORF Transcript_10491/g.22092 Transcript_10491/m.22092 type:complete len:481 (+) Transcript_10491:330-1772(+)